MNAKHSGPLYRTRPATASDLEIILRHRRSMFADMEEGSEQQLDAMVAAARPFVAQRLADGSYRGWLVEADDRVVAGGGVALVPYQPHPFDLVTRRAYVLNVYTEPEYRRRGLARLVMETVVAWCRSQGFVSVALHASRDGRQLYEALGFEPGNEMRLPLR
jgi:GNAT superfamily N-acetyltransferase